VAHLPSLFALRALEAAVRRRSYSAAARELGVTQSAISQQIRKLEAEFGARLFDRRGNEMIPSWDAERLAGELKAGLDKLSGAVGAFADGASRDPLVISMDSRFSIRWLGSRLTRLIADPAGANLDVRVEDRVANFTSDGVDVAVRMGRGDWLGLEAHRLTTERLCVVCTPDFAALNGLRSAGDLARAPLIDTYDHVWPLLFDRHGLATPKTMALTSNNSLLVVDAAMRGVGAALIRYSMVEDDLRAGRLVRPIADIVPLPVNFVRGEQLVRPAQEGDAVPPDYGYFVAWRPDNRKRRRIVALKDWLVAEAEVSEAALV
jgi:LysR family glycine cleavage system transcriptional activator